MRLVVTCLFRFSLVLASFANRTSKTPANLIHCTEESKINGSSSACACEGGTFNKASGVCRSEVHFTMFSPFCIGDEDTCGWAAGASMNIAVEIMVEQINKHRYLMDDSTLVVDVVDDHCNPSIGRKLALELLLSEKDTWPFGVIGSGCSGVTMQLAPIMNTASIPLISHAATNPALSDRVEYPDFFRIYPPDGPGIKVWLHIFFTFGWKKFASGWDLEYGFAMVEFFRSVLRSYNGEMIDVVEGRPVQVLRNTLPQTSSNLLKAIRRTRVRAVVIMSYAKVLSQFACQMSRQRLHGMYLVHLGWLVAGWWQQQGNLTDCSVEEMDQITDLWISANPPAWGKAASDITCAPGGKTVREFADEYEKRRTSKGIEFRSEASAAADAVCMMATIYNEMTADGDHNTSLFAMPLSTYMAWSAKAQAVSFSGSSGSVAFPPDPDAYGSGDRIGPFNVFQKVANHMQMIGTTADGPDGMTINFIPGKSFVFHGEFTMQNLPPELFSECPDRAVYDFQAMRCATCGEETVYIDSTAACECKAGRFENVSGACQACAPGKYSTIPGSKACSNCSRGTYADKEGQRFCNSCGRGTYADVGGLSACRTCGGNLWTKELATKNQKDCECPAGRFLRSDHSLNTCADCPAWLEDLEAARQPFIHCPAGSSQSERPPQLLEGYMALLEDGDVYHVYACVYGDFSCPGLRSMFANGVHMCNGRSLGRACAYCLDAMYPSSKGCKDCNGLMLGHPFILAMAIACVSVLACTRLYYSSMFPPSAIGIAIGQVLTFVQSLVVVADFGMHIPTNVRAMFDAMSVFKLDLSMIGMPTECISGSNFHWRYAIKLFLILYLWLGFAVLYITSFVSWRIFGSKVVDLTVSTSNSSGFSRPMNSKLKTCVSCAKRASKMYDRYVQARTKPIPLGTKLKWYWPINKYDMANCALKTHNLLFITFTSTSLAIFRQERHPSGQVVVMDYPDVVTGSLSWKNGIPIACAGLCFFSVSFVAYLCYVVAIAPARIVNPIFARSHRGFWAKYDPHAWWFGIVNLSYQLLLSVIPAVNENATAQFLNSVILSAIYILIVCRVRPWKFRLNHRADLLTKLGISTRILLSAGGLPREDVEVVGLLMLASMILPVAMICGLILCKLYFMKIAQVQDLGMRARFAERLHDIVKIVGSHSILELRSYSFNLLDNDVRNLDAALDTLLYSVMGLQEKSIWKRRAVPGQPLKFCVPGRLEGELQVRGIDRRDDARAELRILQNIIRDKCTSKHGAVISRSDSNAAVKAIFKDIDQDGNLQLEEDEFVNAIENFTFRCGRPMSRDIVRKMFRYIDVFKDETLTATEFYHAMESLPTPVLDNGESPGPFSLAVMDDATSGREPSMALPLETAPDATLESSRVAFFQSSCEEAHLALSENENQLV